MNFFKSTATCLLAFFVASTTASAFTITGTVSDTQGEPLPDATIRVLHSRDSTFTAGGLTSAAGRFSLSDIPNGRYIVEATYIGFAKGYRNVKVQGANAKVDTIRLAQSSVLLKETTVIGVKTPIKVMTDTIEFNADTYKTQPNAVVEDLLKRLPGVEVDNSGKITANGKEVTKILVDGKEFFADDPKVASKNLPVNMVDKLQVVDRKSDLARLTGVDDGEDETVINLTVKKNMKNGWFGTSEAGYGTDSRYKGTFNINRFFNDNQITFIGNANNTNELGFTDGNGNRFRRFGSDNGINNSQSFGVNWNIGNKEIFRFGGNVMYSHTDRDTRTRTSRQYLFPNDSTSYEGSLARTNDRGHNIRADFRIQWKPDSFNTLDIRPRLSYNTNNSWSLSTDTLRAGLPGLPWVTRSLNRGSDNGTSWEASARIIYTHNFRQHRGRSFSLMANYDLSNVRESSRDFSYNAFARLKDYLGRDSIDSYDQLTDDHTWSNRLNTRVSWTEPLGDASKGNFLQFAYRFSYRWNNADKLVDRRYPDLDAIYANPDIFGADILANPDALPMGPWEPIDTLGNRFRNGFMNQEFRLGFRKVNKNYNLDIGLAAVSAMSRSTDLVRSERNIPERWVWNYAPYARFRYKFSKTSSLNFFYQGRSSQPSVRQLQPVADYSNPLNVTIGNPSLKPTFTHNIRLRFQRYNPDNQSSIMSMMDASVVQNSIISRTTNNPMSGGRITTYENASGVWSVRAMNMFSLPFGSSKQWSFNNNIFAFYNQSVGYTNNAYNRSGSLMIAESPSLAFRPHNLELEVRPSYRLQKVFNSLPNVRTSAVHNYGGSFNGTYYTPFGIVLGTDLQVDASRGYAAGYNKCQTMWNASIAYQFLPGQAATLTAKVYDILRQRQSISRSVTAQAISDIETNTLGRYFMFSFTYRFNTFGKGHEPASRTGGRPFGGPGGPPPGGGPR